MDNTTLKLKRQASSLLGLGRLISNDFRDVLFKHCERREKLGYGNLTDSDMMSIYEECEDKGIKLNAFDEKFFELVELFEKDKGEI